MNLLMLVHGLLFWDQCPLQKEKCIISILKPDCGNTNAQIFRAYFQVKCHGQVTGRKYTCKKIDTFLSNLPVFKSEIFYFMALLFNNKIDDDYNRF